MQDAGISKSLASVSFTADNIANWTIRNKIQGHFNLNSNISIQENAFECVISEKAAILSWPQCVNAYHGNKCFFTAIVIVTEVCISE